MRIGALWDVTAGAIYRAIEPLNAMAARGHEVVVVGVQDGHLDIVPLETCDVVHIYRYLDPTTHAIADHLMARGIGFTWDNDDDYAVFPEDSPLFVATGAAGMAEKFDWSVMTARMAHVVTVTSDRLAERYRSLDVGRVDVIPNAVTAGPRPRTEHDGVVIGWIAGLEHRGDAHQLGVVAALQRLLDTYPDVRVECVGVDLELEGRYQHTPSSAFEDLVHHMAGFDIGIAPLADHPFNHARSDIKVKEYAASGVAWLASELTPYAHLGADQGGRLVADGQWFDALERLVRDERDRRSLARQGADWATTQTIASTADAWEQVWTDAAAAAHKPASPARRTGYGVRAKPAVNGVARQSLSTKRSAR